MTNLKYTNPELINVSGKSISWIEFGLITGFSCLCLVMYLDYRHQREGSLLSRIGV